jgi:hypothetical protein
MTICTLEVRHKKIANAAKNTTDVFLYSGLLSPHVFLNIFTNWLHTTGNFNRRRGFEEDA